MQRGWPAEGVAGPGAAGLRAGRTQPSSGRAVRPLFPPVHSGVAETAEGAVGSTAALLEGPPTFGGCGSGMHLTSGSCSVPRPSAALFPVAAAQG